jgi:hypothetical protein
MRGDCSKKRVCVKQIITYAKFGILGLCIYILYIPSKNLEKPKHRGRVYSTTPTRKDEVILCEKGMER